MDNITQSFANFVNSSNSPAVSPDTENTLFTKAFGEEVTANDQQVLNDFRTLGKGHFVDKYGESTYYSLVQQALDVADLSKQYTAEAARTPGDFVADSVKNVITGALSGLTDTGAFVAGMAGVRPFAEGLSKVSEGIRDIGRNLGSDSEEARRIIYNAKGKALTHRLDREYKEDLAKGMGEVEAKLSYMGKDFGNSVINAFSSGYYQEAGTTAIGNLATGGLVSKGVSKATAIAKTAMPKLEKGIDAFSKTNPLTKKISEATPWMVSMGMQEGGGAYSQQLLEGLNMSDADLRAHSPAFVEAEKLYLEQGYSPKEAAELARRDMAFASAKQAGIETAAAAFVANAITSPLSKILRGDKAVSRYLGESLTEPVEESITEGLGQVAQNRATKEYLDKNQDILEDVGRSAAEGAVGGLGIGAARSGVVGAQLATDPETRENLSNLIDKTLGKPVSDFKNRFSTENIDRTITHLQEDFKPYVKYVPASNEENITHTINSLAETKKQVFAKSVDPQTGKKSDAISAEEASTLKNQINAQAEAVRNFTPDANVPTNKRETLNSFKNTTLITLGKLIKQVDSRVQKSVLENRKSYKPDQELSPEQLSLERSYLNYLNSADPSGALLNNSIKNLAKASPVAAQQVLDSFKTPSTLNTATTPTIDPEEINTNTDSTKASSVTSEQEEQAPIVNSSPYFTEATVEDLEPLKTKQSVNAPAESVENRPGFTVEVFPENRQVLFKIGGKTYIPVPAVRNKLFSKPDRESTEQVLREVTYEFSKTLSPINSTGSENKQARVIKTKKNQKPEKITYVSEQTDEETKETFVDTREYAPKEVAKSFKEKFGDGFSKLVSVMKRPYHIWNSKDPIDFLDRLLSDPDQLKELLKKEQFTDAESLSNKLIEYGGLDPETNQVLKTDKTIRVKEVLDPNDTLINQLRTMLNKDGVFLNSLFKQKDCFALKGDEPEIFSKIFYDEDGKPKELFMKLGAIGTIAWIPKVHNYRHELNNEELDRSGIDRDIQDPSFTTSRGVLAEAATQHLATTFRKVMGVALANSASEEELNQFFGTMAVKFASACIDAGIIEKVPLEVKVALREVNKPNEIVTREKTQLVVSKDYSQFCRSKADVLERLLDPKLKNRWHSQPPKVGKTILHTSRDMNKALTQTTEYLNSTPYHINKTFMSMFSALGGLRGYAEVFLNPPTKDNRLTSNIKDYESREGKLQALTNGANVISEVIFNNIDADGNVKETFFNNNPIKSSRINQEGSATPQSNKFCRVGLQPKNATTIDLSESGEESIKKNWFRGIAQAFFGGLNRTLPEVTQERAEKVINAVEKLQDTYGDLYDTLLGTDFRSFADKDVYEKTQETRAKFFEFCKDFEEETGTKISGDLQMNALAEVMKYVTSTPEQHKTFDSFIYTEVDGTNDGPATIGTLVTMAIATYTGKFVQTAARTGTMLGLDCTLQDLYNLMKVYAGKDGVTEEDLHQAFGDVIGDLHAEVAQKTVVDYFLRRFIEWRKIIDSFKKQGADKNNNELRSAQLAQKATLAMLRLFKAVGYVEGDLDALMSLERVPEKVEDYPIRFEREISKVLVTVIPYGSQPRGTTNQILSWVLPKLYAGITLAVESRAKGSTLSTQKRIEQLNSIFEEGKVSYIVDTETTGLEAYKGDQILQLAIQKLVGGEKVGEPEIIWIENTSKRNPVAEINGKKNPLITEYNKAKKQGKLLSKKQAAQKFKELTSEGGGNAPIIGHNFLRFDREMIEKDFITSIKNPIIDTLDLATDLESRYISKTQDNLIKRYGLEISGKEHLADTDVSNNYLVLKALKNKSDSYVKKLKKEHRLEELSNSDYDFNGVGFETVMNSLETLLTLKYHKGLFGPGEENALENLTSSFTTELPSKKDLEDVSFSVTNSGMVRNGRKKDLKDIRNFYVKTEGVNVLTDVLTPLFGEPAQAAVNEVIGEQGMKGTRLMSSMLGLITILQQDLENLSAEFSGGSRTKLKRTDKYVEDQKLRNLDASYTLGSGAQVVIEKRGYDLSKEPLYKDEVSGLSYRPLENVLLPAGVSGGPISVHAMSDASTVIHLMEELKELKIFINSVYDGHNSTPDTTDAVELAANKAYYKALHQQPINAILNRIETIGNNLNKMGYSNKHGVEAFQECLVRISQDKHLDDNPIINKPKDQNKFAEISRYVTSFTSDIGFIPNMKQASAAKEARDRNLKEYTQPSVTSKNKMGRLLEDFFIQSKAIALNEQINHRVFEKMPGSIHHMCAAESPYKVGKSLSISKAVKLFKEINELNKDSPFESYWDMIGAFMANQALVLYETQFKNKLDPEDRKAFEELINKNKSINRPRDTFNGIEKVAEALGFDLKKNTPYSSNKRSEREISLEDVRSAFTRVSKTQEKPAVYKRIYEDLWKLLPKNTKVKIVSDVSSLPKDVQKHFNSKVNQAGLFVVTKGVPSIYLIDQSLGLNINKPENAEVLAHEVVHAAMSAVIETYYKNSEELSEAQRDALDNIVALMEDLSETFANNPGDGSPTLKGLMNILKGTKKKYGDASWLDEAIAYILTNSKAIEELTTYTMKDPEGHTNKFMNLVQKLVDSAKTFLLDVAVTFLGNNTTVRKYLETKRSDLNGTAPLDFLSLFGANTRVVTEGELTFTHSPDGKHKIRAHKSNKTRKMIIPGDWDKATSYLKNFVESVANRAAARYSFIKKAKGVYGDLNRSKASSEVAKAFTRKFLEENANYKAGLTAALTGLVRYPSETSEAIVELQHPDSITPNDRALLTKIYLQIKNGLSEDFMDGNGFHNKETSKRLYDIISGKSSYVSKLKLPVALVPHFQEQAILLALVKTDPNIRAELLSIDVEVPNAKFKISELTKSLEELGEKISAKWAAEYNKLQLEDAIQIIDGEAKSYLNPKSHRTSTTSQEIFRSIDKAVVKTLFWPFKQVFKKTKFGEFLSFLEEGISNDPLLAHNQITDGLRHFFNKHSNLFTADFTKEIYGRTATNTKSEVTLKQTKGFEDKERKTTLDELPKIFTELFNKTEVTKEFRNYLHKNFGGIEIISLSFEDVKKVLTDPTELRRKTLEVEQELARLHPEFVKEYKAKADALAKYLTGKENATENLLMNGLAIAHLFGTANSRITDIEETANLITQLITLYCIKHQETSGSKIFTDVFTNDSEAMEMLYNFQKTVLESEDARQSKKDQKQVDLYKLNRKHGWLPDGNTPTGLYRLVPEGDKNYFFSQGYDVVGDYDKSSQDTSDDMVRMFCKYPHAADFKEGILQSIEQTAWGFQTQNGTRAEALGTSITSPNAYENLVKNYDPNVKSTGNSLIPIWNPQGQPIGFDRSIPKEDRHYLTDSVDYFSALAQYQARIVREEFAVTANIEAVDMCHTDFENASVKERREEFIDVWNSDNPAVIRAMSRMDTATKKYIKSKFGNHFYIRKDSVWNFIGYHRASLTDMWDNNFMLPKAVEDTVTACLDGLFKIFGARRGARYYVGLAETAWMSLVTTARETIIIRSGVVPFINAAANVLLLHFSLGIPLDDLARLYKENSVYTQRYIKLSREEIKYRTLRDSAVDPRKKAEYDRRMNDAIKEYKNLPIYRLIKEGEISSINVESNIYEEVEILKNRGADWLNTALNNAPTSKKIKNIASEAFMVKGSETYKAMAEFTNMGDFLAKTVGYRYLTERSKKYNKPQLNHDEARNIVSILFVDYDQFVGRERDWTNKIGLTWFMTYKYRMIPAALLSMLLNPARMVLGTAFEMATGFGGTPIMENIFSKIISGSISYSVGFDMLFRGLAMHPLAVLLSMLGISMSL